MCIRDSAAIAVATELDIDDKSIIEAFKNFSGINRRFQVTKNITVKGGKITLIDDYGHHPTEILATINAIKSGWGSKRITLLFQPHRYTRTKELFSEFVEVLSQVDQLIITEIYAAGEEPIDNISGQSIMEDIKNKSSKKPIFVRSLQESVDVINRTVKNGEILLLMGAGDIGSFVGDLPDLLKS